MKERYLRQLQLPDIGPLGQQKLANLKVLCIGAGGLGCSALYYLAAAGVGKIGICDEDVVTLDVLQRQILYREENIGVLKAKAAAKHLSAFNSEIAIDVIPHYLSPENALDLISRYDIILDTADNFEATLLINDACHAFGKPWIHGSVQRFTGQCGFFHAPYTPCWRCLYENTDNSAPNCDELGVLGTVPGMVGTLQAMEAIKFGLELNDSLKGSLWVWDFLKGVPKIYQLSDNPHCPLCTNSKDFGTLWGLYPHSKEKGVSLHQITVPELIERLVANEDIFMLDVRNEDEYQAFNIEGHLIPLPQLSARIGELPRDKPIVIYCRSGQRSQTGLELLQQMGFTQVQNLDGGLLAWVKFLGQPHSHHGGGCC